MLKFTTLACISALSFILLSPVALAQSYAYSDRVDNITYGIHPWDVPTKGVNFFTHRNPYRYSKSYFYLHPDRSQTHALHPYHRDHYYDPPLDPDYARYANQRRSCVRYVEENAYTPRTDELALCGNYSYSKPNYRVPPYRFRCQ